MARPKFFRDPIHGQIGFDAVDLHAAPPSSETQPDAALSWLIRRLIDTPEFQRLRYIRQNGLVNLVFHGAEHSRFGHSMGVCYLAREMYSRITRNMGDPVEPGRRMATCAAALLHDIGHGPFSHVLEEILSVCGIRFEHEWLTRRLLVEPDALAGYGDPSVASVHATLRMIDARFPEQVAAYVSKKWRAKGTGNGRDSRETPSGSDHWTYKLVSSQIDADRLDYLIRDASLSGLPGHAFDIERLLDMLLHLDRTRIAVYRRAVEPVEGYLLALDQMYRTVYYHHTARAAAAHLGCVLHRALDLYRQGARDLFPLLPTTSEPAGPRGRRHPLQALFDDGQDLPLSDYLRLTEYHIFALIEEWQAHRDPVLADLSRRLLRRSLLKAIDVDPRKYNRMQRLQKRAEELVRERLPHVDKNTVQYYVSVDEPERVSYRRYDWRNADPDESIWIVDNDSSAGSRSGPQISAVGANPIDKEPSSIIAALQTAKYFHRLIVPPEIRDTLVAELRS
ncbi:MAG: HD domain-containing protein [Myxococcales bacterium]|nr:HD domain-containing protein [Myxococcales bacterium]